MEDIIRKYLDYLSIEKGYSQGTVQAYEYDIKKFVSRISNKSLKNISHKEVILYMTFLAKKGFNRPNDKSTRARKLSSINSFFKYLVKEGYIEHNPAEGVESPKLDKKEPSFLTEDEINVLLKAVETGATEFYKPRDLAVIRLFLTSGLRLNELTSLKTSDIDLEAKTIKVNRKGGKEQILPLNQRTAQAIKDYLAVRNNKYIELFISRRDRPIDKSTIAYLVKNYMKKARIKGKKLSPHTLRHSFCTALLNKGVNIAVIQQLAGHKSMDTTRKYIHLTDEDLRAAINSL